MITLSSKCTTAVCLPKFRFFSFLNLRNNKAPQFSRLLLPLASLQITCTYIFSNLSISVIYFDVTVPVPSHQLLTNTIRVQVQCGRADVRRRHRQGLRVQAAVQEPRVLLQSGQLLHFQQVHYFTCNYNVIRMINNIPQLSHNTLYSKTKQSLYDECIM